MYLKIGFLGNFAHAFSISGTVKWHPDISHSIGHVTNSFKEPIVRMFLNRTNFAGQDVLSNALWIRVADALIEVLRVY